MLPSFTTESLLDFFDVATDEPLLGELLTTAGLFPGMLQTTAPSFIFPPVNKFATHRLHNPLSGANDSFQLRRSAATCHD